MGDTVVSGYAKRIFYPGGIEYRNYAADLVGNQSAAGNSIFTSNNFVVTTNLDPKANNIYQTNKFSKFYSQDNLSIDSVISKLTSGDVTLNPDPSKLDSYAYFGSLKEFVRVSLENIITNWPASLYVTDIQPLDGVTTGNTVLNYSYDINTNISRFEVDTDFLINKYNINFLNNAGIIAGFKTENPLRSLTTSFTEFVIDNNSTSFPVLGFTGSTSILNDVLTFEVKGNPFISGTSFVDKFHIRPNDVQKEKYFKSLNRFENYLLNRQTLPLYSAEFSYPIKTDIGVVLYQSEKLTWPSSDGYNIDFNTQGYVDYASNLVRISESFDDNKTDLIHRFLTAESISSFDTPNTEESVGMKITKFLRIMGRSFDDIKKYIDGTAFGTNITYNKKENVPDELVKTLARSMGWTTTASLLDNDAVEYFLKPSNPSYLGQSVGMTTAESEIELWRRLLINSPWLFKSKGTRKAIEFLLEFIGTPNGLIEFKEYIYKADKPVDVSLINEIYEELSLSLDSSEVWFDSKGYPKTVSNNSSMYFQKGGLWYRETAGSNARIYVKEGNNPHIGPYDGGKDYLSNFTCLVPDFKPLTITKETITSGETKLYVNYNDGRVNDCPDICQTITTIPATVNSGGLVQAVQASNNGAFGSRGALFFPNVMSATLPVKRMDATEELKQNNGSGPDFDFEIKVPHANNTIWNERLNIAGIRKDTQNYKEFVGFSSCIEIPTTGTYYVGMAADNYCKFSINSTLIVDLTESNYSENFKYWNVFRIELSAGTHLIEMVGANDNSTDTTGNAFAAEIYGADLSVLTGATNISQTERVFSTEALFNTTLSLGGTWKGVAPTPTGTDAPTGYSCPAGFALNTCATGTPKCSKIVQSPCGNPITITGNTYFNILMPDNSNGSQCYDSIVEKIDDAYPTIELTDCGCPVDDCDDAIRIGITRKDDTFVTGDTINVCGVEEFELLGSGQVEFTIDGVTTPNISSECCTLLGFTPSGYAEQVRASGAYIANLGAYSVTEYVLENGIIYQEVIPTAFAQAEFVFFDGNIEDFSYGGSSLTYNNINILNNEVIAGTKTISDLNTDLGDLDKVDPPIGDLPGGVITFNTTLPLTTCNWN